MVEKLKEIKLPKAAALIERAVPDTLAYYAFPDTHWRSLRTNNPMERLVREIRRRTRVVGAFPDGQSALMDNYVFRPPSILPVSHGTGSVVGSSAGRPK